MTVKQLKGKLDKYPDSMDVFVDVRFTEFKYGLVNSVGIKLIGFSEEDDDDDPVLEHVVVISEEL